MNTRQTRRQLAHAGLFVTTCLVTLTPFAKCQNAPPAGAKEQTNDVAGVQGIYGPRSRIHYPAQVRRIVSSRVEAYRPTGDDYSPPASDGKKNSPSAAARETWRYLFRRSACRVPPECARRVPGTGRTCRAHH